LTRPLKKIHFPGRRNGRSAEFFRMLPLRFDILSAGLGVALGAVLWSQLPATQADTLPNHNAVPPVVSQDPVPEPAAPPPPAVVEPAPPVALKPPKPVREEYDPPELLGTIVGTPTVAAIFEYDGHQRILHEGQRIGPFIVGGVYSNKASLKGPYGKFFVGLKPQVQPQVSSISRSSANTDDGWIKGQNLTQVIRDGEAVGVLLRDSQGGSPLADYGVEGNDVLTSVNHRPVRSQADLWWLHQELQHASRLEVTIMRHDQEQTLCQDRTLARAR